MEGVEYTAEPELMNDEEMADARVPSKKARTDSYRHPNTYPPLPGAGGPPMYSAPPSRSRDPSISSQGPLSSIQSYNAGVPASFSSMTESPKPISPGQSGEPRGTMAGPPRPHAPSYGSSGRGNSPLGLPPPHMSGAQLPAIHGFPTPSLPGSLSSHNSSAASTREILGGAQQEHLWTTIRDLKTQVSRMQEEHSATVAQMRAEYNRMDEEYQRRIEALNHEVAKSRGGGGKEVEEIAVDSRLK
jgi:hypothetical protein